MAELSLRMINLQKFYIQSDDEKREYLEAIILMKT